MPSKPITPQEQGKRIEAGEAKRKERAAKGNPGEFNLDGNSDASRVGQKVKTSAEMEAEAREKMRGKKKF